MSIETSTGIYGHAQLDESGDSGESNRRDEFDYARFVAQLRVLETRLLTRAQLMRMVDSPDPETAFRLLFETEYGPAVAAAGSVFNYEVALAAELARVFALLRQGSPDQDLVGFLGFVYDLQNLKTVLKAALVNRPLEPGQMAGAGSLSPSLLAEVARTGSATILPEPFRSVALQASRTYGATGDPQEIDLVVDAARFPLLISQASSGGYDLLARLGQATADLVNLRTLLRLKALKAAPGVVQRALVAGGSIPVARLVALFNAELEEIVQALTGVTNHDVLAAGVQAYRSTGSLALYEKLMDDRLLSLTEESRYTAFGPEPIIAYLMAKETEIKNLRIIFIGKINRLPENTIRERLRETYA
jgi:V/A-type H+-transporting ATPase subunit C